MDSLGNLMNGNPMALNKYIFQVMYPNKYYIFGIIEEYYDKLRVFSGVPKHHGPPADLRTRRNSCDSRTWSHYDADTAY